MPGISQPFKIHSLVFGRHTIQVAQVENVESLFDELLKKNSDDADVKDERIPYWSELWPSSIALSEFLSEKPELVKGKKILEIGCGLGLSGIVAAKFGGRVVLSDYLPDALTYASYNWKLNFSEDADIRLLDWRSPGKITPFDVVLASDVAYESRSFKPLLQTFKSLVKKDGVIIISEPNRKFAKEFFKELNKAGFNITEEIRSVVKDGIKYKISIYKLIYK